jgi:hypothetical protein
MLRAEALEPTPSGATSQVAVEGFTALNDLRARLQWGGVVLEEEVKKGSSSVKFVVNALNIRSALNISIEPDGLSMELIPTAMGYSPKKLSIGSNVRVEGALKVAIKETLTVMNLVTFVAPPKAVNRVLINGRDVPFIADAKNTTSVALPSSLIVDIGRPVNITIEGEGFTVSITARKGLGERAIDVTAEAEGNVSEVSVRASSARVVAVQEIYVPLQSLNVTNVLEDYGPLHVLFSKEKAPSVEEETELSMQSKQKAGEKPLTLSLLAITRYKWALLLTALIALCTAIMVGRRSLAVFALILFIAYFALAWLGGGL